MNEPVIEKLNKSIHGLVQRRRAKSAVSAFLAFQAHARSKWRSIPGPRGSSELVQSFLSRKSAPACTVRNPVLRVSVGVLCVALCAVLVVANVPATAFAQSSCPGIHVKILNIRNSTGAVACALFEALEGFPAEFLRHATNIMMIKIRDTQARCDFLDIPPGTYALAVIHDENMDGELGTDWLGVPTEGYAFSSGAKAAMSAPSFEAASFPYDGQNLDLTIKLNY